MKKKLFISSLVASLLMLVGGFFYMRYYSTRSMEIIVNSPQDEEVRFAPQALSGKHCANASRRPYAVIMSSDTAARPLSGIARADLVVEMSVIKNGITRIMAFFGCEEPREIGSVRSAREDFIPLAASFDAILAHWGGSHSALDILKGGVIDNIDALVNPYGAFSRKTKTPEPHNGFTSFPQLVQASQKLGFRSETSFSGYSYISDDPSTDIESTTVSIGYPEPYNINYIYSKEENSYLRWRGGSPEHDALDGRQVKAKVLVILRTSSRQVDSEYNDVILTGSGDALVFQNGSFSRGTWRKEPETTTRLVVVDDQEHEIPFVAGTRWIEIIDLDTPVIWGSIHL